MLYEVITLGSPTMPAMAMREIIEGALTAEPGILDAVACDICAVTDRDPAVIHYSTPLLYLNVITSYSIHYTKLYDAAISP